MNEWGILGLLRIATSTSVELLPLQTAKQTDEDVKVERTSCSLDDPFERDVDVAGFFDRYRVDAALPPRDLRQIPALHYQLATSSSTQRRDAQLLDELPDLQRPRQVVLVPEHEQRYPRKLRLVEQRVQLDPGGFDAGGVGRVEDEEDGGDASAVALPH